VKNAKIIIDYAEFSVLESENQNFAFSETFFEEFLSKKSHKKQTRNLKIIVTESPIRDKPHEILKNSNFLNKSIDQILINKSKSPEKAYNSNLKLSNYRNFFENEENTKKNTSFHEKNEENGNFYENNKKNTSFYEQKEKNGYFSEKKNKNTSFHEEKREKLIKSDLLSNFTFYDLEKAKPGFFKVIFFRNFQ